MTSIVTSRSRRIATGAALPVSTQHPAVEDEYSTPNFLSTIIDYDYFGPTLPTTTEEDQYFPAETLFPTKMNGETPEAVGEGETSSPGEPLSSGLASSKNDSGSLISMLKIFKIPEDLKETVEDPSVKKSALTQVNSSEPTLGKETLQGDPLAESQEASKETPSPDLDTGHEATELITERYSGITDAPMTVLATLEEDFLASPSTEEAQTELSSEGPPDGDKPLENIPGEPNLEEEFKPTSTSWEETKAAPLEAEKDTPEPSMDESGTVEDPSSNATVFSSTPEDLPDQGTGENVDAGDQPLLFSEDSPETSRLSTGFPPIRPLPTDENFGSPGASDFDVGSLQPSPASVDPGSPEGRGDTDPIPSSSGPELNHESPVNLPSEEPEDLVDAEASNSSPSDRTTDGPSDSGPPGDTLVRTSQLDASDIPLMGLSVTPEIPSQLPEDGEVGATSTVEEEGEEEDSGNPKSNEGTSSLSPLPGQESAQGTEIPDEERSADLLSDTASSLNPGVETANSELEDSEAATTSNSVPEDEINPISSVLDTVSENESGALFEMTASSPPPVDNEGADGAQEPPAESQRSSTEISALASTDGPSSETEGNEVSPSGSPGNIGSSFDEVDTEANSEGGSGTDLSPPGSTNEPSDTELSPISGTPLPMGRSGTLNDPLSPSQSLVENALTSGSNFSSEGEPTFPSTSPDEALSGSLISEPDATELPSNSLPGSQPSSQLPKEDDMETGSGDLEGPPAEASAPGSTNEPSSVREGSEVLSSGSPEGSQPSSQPPKEDDMETGSGDIENSPPPPVDSEEAAKAQGPPAETSGPGSTKEPSPEREGSEALPSGSPGNMGSPSENSDTIPSGSSDEVDTQANSEDDSGSDLPPPDTELSPISGTPLPMERSGTLNDPLSPSQSLVENALTSGSSFSSEGEPTFPSTSPDEAPSGSLISEPDATELPSNSLSGSQPSSQLPKEDDMETGSGDLEGPTAEASAPGSTNEPSSVREGSEVLPSGSPEGSQTSSQLPKEDDMETGSGDIEDSPPPPVDNQGDAKAQGPPAETSAPGSINEPSSEREGSEILPSGSPEGSQPSSQPPKEDDMETGSGDIEDSPPPPPVDNQGDAKAQGPPAETSAPGSTNEPSSEREGSEILPSGSPQGSQPSSQPPKEDDMETGSGDIEDSPPPPVDNEEAAKAEGPPAETSAPGSTNEPSSEREGSEALPSGSPGNMGSPSENSDTIPSVSSDEVDTQANSEDRSVSDLSPSETGLSSISGIPLATSPQPPKEDDTETHSEVPEDSVTFDGEETSSAPSTISPQSALAEATEEPSISGDSSDGPILSPKEKRIGSTSEPGVNEEPLLDGDNTQDKINTRPSEQQLGSEDALESSIPSSGDEPDVKSGTIPPLVDTEMSTKTQEPSGETSSASIEDMLSNSENEDGEPSPSLSPKTLDSTPGSEVVDERRDGEDDTGSASSAKTAVTVSNNGQPRSDFLVGQLVTSPVGGILALAPLEDEETSVPRDDAQLSTGAVSSEVATPQSASSAEGTETSASEPFAGGSQPSPDDEAAPGTSKKTEQLQTSAASEKVSPLASLTRETQEPTTSESGEFSGALNKESPAFPVEVAGTANSPPATDKSIQFLPEGVVSSDGVEEDSEDITNMISEISSQDPLDRGSESKTPTSEEDIEGLSDGQFSLNNNGTETATVESANNGLSQLLPDGVQPSTTTGTSERSEGPSSVNGKEGSLIPSAAESHSTSASTEEVENANLESGTHPEYQSSLDGSPTSEVQDSKSAEAVEEDTSNNGEKLSLTWSATTSQSPGISDGEAVSGGTGESSLPGEELETTGSGSTNNAGAQPSVMAGGATETSDVSNRVQPLESSSSASEGETSLASSATESSTALEDQEVSGKPSDGAGVEAVNSEPATNAEPQSSPNGVVGSDEVLASEEAGTPEVSGMSEGSLAASGPESQAISSSHEEETSKTVTNAGSQLPLDGKSSTGTPPPDGAKIVEASSSVPGEKESLSPSTPESQGDSSSTKEVGTASRKSTTDEGSQLSPDGTSPEGSLASEGAEPTESHSIASGEKASLVPSVTELQLPETSANENILGGLENGEFSLSPGKEIANAGSTSNNAGSQTSPDSVATEGEEAETSEDDSVVSEKQSLAPSSTQPQSPGTLVSKDVSENLVNEEPSLSSDGGTDTANIGTAGAQVSISSTGTGVNQNNVAEQFGQNSESISGQPSSDGAMIAESPEETSIPSSVSSDGNLATQGMSQDFGAPDSSQPSSDIQGNLANSISAGRAEDSLPPLGDHISIGDTLGVSDGPTLDAKPGGEVLQGVSEVLDSVNNLIHPSSAEGTKPAAGQLSGVASPLAFLLPQNGLLLAPSKLGGPKLGSVVGKGSSPSTPEEKSEVFNSILAIHKGLSTASSADGVQPSLLGAKGSPAKASKLVPGKPGLQDKDDALLLFSKPEVPAKASKLASGKPGLQGKGDALQLSSKPEIPAKASKLASGKPGLQGKGDALQLSSKPEVPAKASKLASGKPGLQGKGDAPQLSSKPEVPAKASKLASGKPGLQSKGDAPQLSSKPEVPAKASKLASGKPGLQGKGDAPQLSSKPEVPAKTSKLASGKPGLQGKGDAPQLSSKPEVPAELASGKPGLQLTADTRLLSINSDVLANLGLTLPGKPGPASPDSSSASDEKDGNFSSGSNSAEEHQSFMKGKVALDLSKAKLSDVHLALSGVGLLATKFSEPAGKTSRRKSDSKKSKDKKTKRDEKPAVVAGAPSGAAVSLYPYGASVNDKQYVERKVDFRSPLFKPEIGIPFGKTLRNSLYFTDNGQIIFPASDKDISSYPNPPSSGFNGREEVPMVAVFWDNADFSRGSGTIFYQTNTYQAILTTDGYRTYALFLYQDGGMQWDYTKLSAPNVLIGYTSGDGYFKNDNLMTQTPAEKYRPDGFQGYNTDVRGLWIYKLDSKIHVNYRQRCLDWLGHESLPSAWNRNLPPCPCSLQQGMSDNRYTTSQKGGENSGLTLLYSSSPNIYGAGVRCLYNQSGRLQEGRQERVWKNSRKNYPNNDEELKLHDWCCNKAGNPQMCEKYDQKRPRIGCQGYKPPI
ncbi:mucin-4 [Ahaetulla prasina]|uniref:mucin-4 n=1 Tax=Ahaetulla prasina TaxID=499056 RepID=UPI0026474649|nr:mucin-4 [Ahaetulla prasina]